MSTSHIRKFALIAVAFAGVVSASADSAAGPTGLVLRPQPSVHLEAFRRTVPQIGSLLPYTGGPLPLEVVVQNDGAKEASGVTVKLAYQGGVLTEVVNVPARGTMAVKFTDPVGLVSGCAPRKYQLSVEGAGGVTDNKEGVVTPSCKLSTTITDQWNLAVPDRVEEAQKDSVYFTNAVVESATCLDGVKIKGQITNHSKLSSPSLIVQANANGQTASQTAAAFPLAAGESKTVYLTPVGAKRDVPDQLDVTVIDWTHSLGTHLRNQGIAVKTTKSCALQVGFAPPVAMATAPSK